MPPITVVADLACIMRTCTQHIRNLLCLHAHIQQIGLNAHPLIANWVVPMLVKGGSMSLAQQAFDQLFIPTALSWNSLITGYVKHGEFSHALMMYMRIQAHDPVFLDGYSFLALLKACIELKDLNKGSLIHQQIIQSGLLEMDIFLSSALVDMYAKCGSMAKAHDTFDNLEVRDAVTWTALIAGYVEDQQGEEALDCVMQMQQEGVSPDAFTFSCSLKACGIVGARDKGQQLHRELIKVGLEKDLVVSSTLIDMYAKQECVEDAFKVFDTLPIRNIVSWNALLTGLTECGHSKQTLECFQKLLSEEILPDVVTFTCVLKACGSVGTLTNGEEMHILILKIGVESETLVGNSLIDMYAKCGALTRAQEVFDSLSVRSVVSWNALIGGYVEDGQGDEALKWLKLMEYKGMPLDHVTYWYGLKACGSIGATDGVKEIHAAIVLKGVETNLAIVNTLVDIYAKCGMLVESQEVFDKAPTRDRVSWNVLISGYVENAHGEAALECSEHMQHDIVSLDAVTFSCCLKACGILGATTKGQRVHAEIFKKGLEGDPFVANSLLDMYGKCGLLVETQAVFNKLRFQTIVPWNTMIKGYIEYEFYEESIHCFEQMQHEGISPKPIMYVYCLKACSNLLAVDKGRKLHSKIIKLGLDGDILVGSSLVDMYSRWGWPVEAHSIFSRLSVRTLISWTALLVGYVDSGYAREVLDCLKQIKGEGISLDDVVYTCGLRASATLGALDKGMELHAEIVRRGLEGEYNVNSTLILAYSKCSFLMEAQKVFDGLQDRNIVSLTALLTGYVEHGYDQEALHYLEQMQHCSSSADNIALVCGLKVCSIIGNRDRGQDICSQIIKRGLERNLLIGNALVDMYAKCGLLLEAQGIFDELLVCEESSWTALITGYAQLGDSQNVFFAFHRMLREGVFPNLVTFLSVLNVCTHAGLLDHGEAYFVFMDEHYEITPILEHYNCMIDLFARAGDLGKALTMVNTMPLHPPPVVWQTMLGACRKWKNVDIGTHVFEHLVQIDERDCAAYVCVHNIYADAGLDNERLNIE